MEKTTIQRLTDIMVGIHTEYYEKVKQPDEIWGDVGKLWVHEGDNEHKSVNIDLYHFEGDGKPVCDGLKWQGTCPRCGKEHTLRAFCVCYSPTWEQPLCVMCYDDDGECDDWKPNLTDLPEHVLTSIADWLEDELKTEEQ